MIPKIIHQIIGPKINSAIERCLLSWHVLEQVDFEIRIWNDASLESFLRNEYPFAIEAFLNARNHAEAADIARYLIMFHFGGHYMDWDVQLLKPNKYLDLYTENIHGYLIVDPTNETLASEAFASEPRNPFFMFLTENIVELYNSGRRSAMNTPHYSGPFRMRDALAQFGNTNLILVPVKKIFAYDYSEIRSMKKIRIHQPLIHYWMHTWL